MLSICQRPIFYTWTIFQHFSKYFLICPNQRKLAKYVHIFSNMLKYAITIRNQIRNNDKICKNKMFSVTYWYCETYLYITPIMLRPFWTNMKKLQVLSPTYYY